MINIMNYVKEKNIKFIIVFVLICITSVIGLSNVHGVDWSSEGSSIVATGDVCDLTNGTKTNGCLGHGGWRFTVIRNYSKSSSGINYTAVSTKKYTYSGYYGNLDGMIQEVKKGGSLFTNIISEAGISQADFFNSNNNYYILAEPLFAAYYWNSKLSCEGQAGCYKKTSPGYNETGITTAYGVASHMIPNYYTYKYDGISYLVKNLSCTAFLRYPNNNSYDNYCDVAYNNNMFDYLSLIAMQKNTRYASTVISAKDVTKRGQLTVIKKWEDHGEIMDLPLSYAYFDIYNGYNCSGSPIDELGVGDKEKKTLPVGSYSLKETRVEYDFAYEVDKTCHNVYVPFEGTSIEIINREKKVNVKINKVDENGNKITSGTARFRLYGGYRDCDERNYMQTLDVRGIANISLPYGDYSLKEVSAPNGYEITSTCTKFHVYLNTNNEVTIKNNEIKKGNLKIIKTDTSGNKITSSSATFNVYKNGNCSGDAIRTINMTGEYSLLSIDAGTYSLKETKAPNGYEMDSSCKSVSITKNSTNTITIQNKKLMGKLKINKLAKDTGKQITTSAATFNLYKDTKCLGSPIQSFSVLGEKTLDLEIGTYYIKETSAPRDYYLNTGCSSSIAVNKDVTTTINIVNTKMYGYLDITKVDDKDEKIVNNSRPAVFSIYKNNNCSGSPFKTTRVQGNEIIQLDIGNYSIKETQAPNGYLLDQSCKTFEIKKDETLSWKVSNVKDCQLAFDSLSESDKTNPLKRIELYEKFLNKNGLKYTNLLKFDEVTNPCGKYIKSENTLEAGCLSCQNTKINFNEGNLSEHNSSETIPIGEKTAYCNVVFDLKNNLKSNGAQTYEYVPSYTFESNSPNKKFKSGQMVLNRKAINNTIAKGTLIKTCYVYGSDSNSVRLALQTYGKLNYNDYIKSISLNDSILKTWETSGTWDIMQENYNNNNYIKFTKRIITDYNLNARYSKVGSGDTTCESESPSCKLLGYGFETKLNTKDGNYSVPFRIEVDSKNLGLSNGINVYSNDKCKYSIQNDITAPGELNIEFRPIDTSNPFPGRSGSGRKVGTNWCSGNNCGYDNSSIKEIMNRTNSYNRKGNLAGNGPIYTIRLTPAIIEDIRKYNSKTTYDDYLECDTVACKSKFLKQFNIRKK